MDPITPPQQALTPQPGAGASGPPQKPQAPALMVGQKQYSDAQLVDKFTNEWKKESFDQRWVYERLWMRNIWYVLNRQWIYFDSKRGQWQDKRLAKWVPRPVTNIIKDGIQTVRANFAAINYGATARPVGNDNMNIVTASVADDYIPILHEDHKLDAVMNEHDFWMLACGNAWLHTAVNYDRQNGTVQVRAETCVQCQQTFSEVDIAKNKNVCPTPQCGSTSFMPAVDEQGQPVPPTTQTLPKGQTIALSPFEIAFPLVYERFDLTPYAIRMRWRTKADYERDAEMSQYVSRISWSKTPAERTMQIFKTLPFQSDLGISNSFANGANTEMDGVVEYDVWMRPSDEFPEGMVIRFAGDQNPLVIHSEKENLPGPLPYHDGKGNPIYTFHHSRYETVGGRAIGSSLIDPGITKQDQLNQLDSHMLMIIGRMANPVWLEPKGAEVEKFTGEPGLVVKWNPMVAGGNAKPERIPGEGINPSVFQYRSIVKEEAQELMGTFDILKGQKPSGVEAYAAMQLLLERGQAKHASAYKERAASYRGAMGDALSIEQEFGPEERVKARMGGNRQWSFDTFQKADLKGTVEIVIEDGTQTPKTNLGERASIDHLNSLMLIDPNNQDTKRKIYEKFGQSDLLPEIDAQVQEAWMNMDRFEKFVTDPAKIQQLQQQVTMGDPNAQMPLMYKRWYNAAIHRAELIKWILSDRGRTVFTKNPGAEKMVDAYLAEIDMALMAAQMGMVDSTGAPTAGPGGPGGPGGVPPGGPGAGGPGGPPQRPNPQGGPMAASNRNAGGAGPTSSGAGGTAQPQQ